MSGPKHLWSGDWERESAEAARRRTGQALPERSALPEPPPPPAEPARQTHTARPAQTHAARPAQTHAARPTPTPSAAQSARQATPPPTPRRERLPRSSTPGADPSRKRQRNRVRPPVALAVGVFVAVAAVIGIVSLLNASGGPSRAAASATRPWLGVQLETLPIDRVMVAGVTPGGPADQAGIGPGDVITSIHGQQVASPGDVYAVLDRLHAGDSVGIQVDRGSLSITTRARLASRPANASP